MRHFIKTGIVAVLVAFLSFSFTNTTDKKIIKTSESQVVWKGYKVTGSHEGTIAIASGELHFNGAVLTGGAFVMDMSTISSTDLEGEYKDKLDGHLKSDDFFGVANHPKAQMVFTDVKANGKNAYTVTADLTIKGKTAPVTVNFSVYGNKATATLKVDRTKYDVRYGSASFFDGLKDKTIYDEFDLVADLVF